MQASDKVKFINEILDENFASAYNKLNGYVNTLKSNYKQKFGLSMETALTTAIGKAFVGTDSSNLKYAELISIKDDINHFVGYSLDDTARELHNIKYDAEKIEKEMGDDANPTLLKLLAWKYNQSNDTKKRELIRNCLGKINEYAEIWNDICDKLDTTSMDSKLTSKLQLNPVKLIIIEPVPPSQRIYDASSNHTPAMYPSSVSTTSTTALQSSSSSSNSEKPKEGNSSGPSKFGPH